MIVKLWANLGQSKKYFGTIYISRNTSMNEFFTESKFFRAEKMEREFLQKVRVFGKNFPKKIRMPFWLLRFVLRT